MEMKVATILIHVVLVLCYGCINAHIDQRKQSRPCHTNLFKHTQITPGQERSLTLTLGRTVDNEIHANSFKHYVYRPDPNYPLNASTLQKCINKCENNGHCCGNRLNGEVDDSSHNLLSCANGCEIAFYVSRKSQCKYRCAKGNESSSCRYDPPDFIVDFNICNTCKAGCNAPVSINECSNGCEFADTVNGFYDPPSGSDKTLLTIWCTEDDPCGYHFQGIFAILWDINKYGDTFRKDAKKMGDILSSIRNDMQNELQMEDPRNPSKGVYVNIFVHGEDKFPDDWPAAVGTDEFSNPFMMLPRGLHLDYGYLEHETFHIFQYNSDSPGFSREDAHWYIESTANWYWNLRKPLDSHGSSGVLEANPHVALWHGNNNGPPGENNHWIYGNRQYALGTFLFYLTEIANIPRSKISSGYYGGVIDLPQQHLFNMIGGAKFRTVFADWAAHNVNNFDYLTVEDVQLGRDALQQQNLDPAFVQPYNRKLDISEILGTTQYPRSAYQPRGWSYNVIKLSNSVASTYYLHINGEEKGEEGAKSYFEGRIVVMGNRATRFQKFNMKDGLIGASTVFVTKADKEIFLIIVAVPNHFTGNQKYGYSFMISDSPTSSPPVSNPASPPVTAPTLSPAVEVKKKYKYDSAIDVIFNNPDAPRSTDFVGLYEAPPKKDNVPLTVLPSLDLRFWQYTCGTGQKSCSSNGPQSGTLTFDVIDPKIEDDSYWPPPPGKYRVCMGTENSDKDVVIGKCQQFKIANPPKKVIGNLLKLKPKAAYKYGNVITIQYTWRFPTRNAWVGLYRLDGSKPKNKLKDTDWWVYVGCNNQSGDQSESDDCSKVKKKGTITFQNNDIVVGKYYICLSIYSNVPYTKFKCSKTFQIKA